MNQTSNQYRILAVSLSSRGFGYASIEGENTLLDHGKKRIIGDKNAGSLEGIEKVIARNQPAVLVLQDINNAKGTRRVPRIKKLHRKIVMLAMLIAALGPKLVRGIQVGPSGLVVR